MSTLQVSNIHFESTGNNRLQYIGSNSFNMVAGGSTVATINTTAISYPLEVSLNDATISGNLAVTGNTTLTGAATLSNTVAVTGAATLSNTISVTGAATLSNTVAVTGAATFSNTVAVTGDITVSKGLNANGSLGSDTQVLSSNGSSVYWADAGGGDYVMTTITSTGTWTKPANLKKIKVTVVGAGGLSGGTDPTGTPNNPNPGYDAAGGGGGGTAIKYLPAPNIPGPVSVTVGTVPATRTSSFGAFCSATGGSNGGPTVSGGAGGTGTGGDLNLNGRGGGGSGVTAAGLAEPLGGGGSGGVAIFGGGYGAGAGSGGQSAQNGVVVVEEFY